MTLTQPVADLAITYTPSTTSGSVVVDLSLSPAGDAALVVGKARLAQDMARWLATPVGSQFSDPSFGSSLWAVLGRPSEASDETYISAVEELESSLLHSQTVAAAAGYLDLAAQIESVEDTRVDRSVPGQVAVGFTVRTRSGEQVQGATPIGG
jgi:hypothetical protein